MWQAVVLTVVATAGNNIGKVLQKKATTMLPPLAPNPKVIRAYVSNVIWVIGFSMDMSGAALMLKAISQAPVSIVQPIAGCGLAILCVFSHFYLKELMNALDWVAITLAGLGTIGVGVGGEEQNVSDVSIFSIPWLALSVAMLFALLNTWLNMNKKKRRDQELASPEVIEEIIYGLESGILFGVSSVISKMGFILAGLGFFPTVIAPAGILVSVVCSGVGFIYQTRGLKQGRAIVVSTCTSVSSIVTAVVAGMLTLGEKLPSTSAGRFCLLVGWFFIISGVILLVCSAQLIALLPKPMQRFLKSSTDRTHGARRSTSLRTKDSSPATVVHATSLNLLSPMTKEKP